jgi:hypothetical protein
MFICGIEIEVDASARRARAEEYRPGCDEA